jgi:hypothetical protein
MTYAENTAKECGLLEHEVGCQCVFMPSETTSTATHAQETEKELHLPKNCAGASNESFHIIQVHKSDCPAQEMFDSFCLEGKITEQHAQDIKNIIRSWESRESSAVREAIDERIEWVKSLIESKYSDCTCGCNFMDGCLCKERREGYEKAKADVLNSITKGVTED